MAIQEGPDEIGQAAIKTDYPVEEGLTAGTQTQKGRQPRLIPENPTLLEQANNKQELID